MRCDWVKGRCGFNGGSYGGSYGVYFVLMRKLNIVQERDHRAVEYSHCPLRIQHYKYTVREVSSGP